MLPSSKLFDFDAQWRVWPDFKKSTLVVETNLNEFAAQYFVAENYLKLALDAARFRLSHTKVTYTGCQNPYEIDVEDNMSTAITTPSESFIKIADLKLTSRPIWDAIAFSSKCSVEESSITCTSKREQ